MYPYMQIQGRWILKCFAKCFRAARKRRKHDKSSWEVLIRNLVLHNNRKALFLFEDKLLKCQNFNIQEKSKLVQFPIQGSRFRYSVHHTMGFNPAVFFWLSIWNNLFSWEIYWQNASYITLAGNFNWRSNRIFNTE